MITIGYKSKFSSILRALSAIALGVVMVISNNATVTVIRVIAALLFAAGVISLVYSIVNHKNKMMGLLSIPAIVDVVIGLLLFFYPEPVTCLIVYLIGILLVVFGVIQLIALSSIMSILGAGFFSLMLSILVIIGGVVLLFNPFTMKVMSIIGGCFLIIYGVQELRSAWKMDKAMKTYEIKFGSEQRDENEYKSSSEPDMDGIKDVEYHKIDEQ